MEGVFAKAGRVIDVQVQQHRRGDKQYKIGFVYFCIDVEA